MRLSVALFLWVLSSAAWALPLYTAREGRTCDNCHTLPNTWKNPEEIKDRKCTMSCSVCHIDPSGGGLRNVSGRFYGQSTLPGLLASHRGYKDTVRFLAPGLRALETPAQEREEYTAAKASLEEIRVEALREKALISSAEESLRQASAASSLAAERASRAAAQLAKISEDYAVWLPEEAPDEISEVHDRWLQQRSAAVKEEEESRLALAAALALVLDHEAALQKQQASYEAARQRYIVQREVVLRSRDALTDAEDWLFAPSFGAPLGESSKMDFVQGRYGSLLADPLVTAGLDLRFASWSVEGGTQVFPMQVDVQAAVQPVQHLTAYVNAGALSKAQGFAATARGEHPFAAKEAFLMVHELPFNAYAKAGRFLPQFGVRQEDHTAYTRRDFELDNGILESRAFGLELGVNANYPYANVALFRPGPRDEFYRADNEVPTFGVDGLGAALNVGYRQLGWQVGASLLTRNRALEDGGDTRSVSVQWGVNPWFYSDRLPFTYLGEYAFGSLERSFSGQKTQQFASFHELNYTPWNGVNLKVKLDLADPDLQVRDDHQTRYSAGAELAVLPGVKLSLLARSVALPGNETVYGRDLFLQLRLWL